MIVTGGNLRYETAKEVVTAIGLLEYYEDTKLAVARGHAIADQPTRHIRRRHPHRRIPDAPNGQTQLTKMTSQGHVTVITKARKPTMPCRPKTAAKSENTKGGDVSRGDRAVYDAGSKMAILTAMCALPGKTERNCPAMSAR